MKNDRTEYEVLYKDFDYKGHKSHYFYEIPFDKFMEGVRAYFDNQMINIDGKDNDVWNALVDLECLDNLFYAMEDWFEEHCREAAFEEYKEVVEEDIELDIDDNVWNHED